MQKFRAIGIPSILLSPTLATGAFGEIERKRRKGRLQRLFSSFPGGWPGVGLFLLRGAIGVVALIQGGYYLSDAAHSTIGIWLGLLGLAAGGSLLAGLLTPIAGVVVGLDALGAGFSVLPAPAANL